MTNKKLPYLIACIIMLSPALVHAQATLAQDTITMQKARVTTVADQQTTTIPGTDTSAQTQSLTVIILDGPDSRTSVTFENDYIQLKAGDVFYLRHITDAIDSTS